MHNPSYLILVKLISFAMPTLCKSNLMNNNFQIFPNLKNFHSKNKK